MRTITNRWKTGMRVISPLLLLVCLTAVVWGQSYEERLGLPKVGKVTNPAGGAGVMVSGDFWDSFLPPNVGPYYGEASQPIIGTFMRIGNFDRAWTTPTSMWPGGWQNGQFWGKGFYLTEYNPDSTWNPPTIGGNTNPSYRSGGGRYAHVAFQTGVLGASNPARNYYNETSWVDANQRHHAVYTAGWPTTAGIDVKVKIHQFSLNWNNFNDFIIVEVSLINTGSIDMNADGVAERTNNTIHALTFLAHGEYMSSYTLSASGGRGNRFGSTRAIGYIGDNDGKGNPWDVTVAYPGESAPGVADMGLNDFPLRHYTDVWQGWTFLGVKQGMDATSDQTYALPAKNTIYGTDAIGTGVHRGWYATSGQGRGLGVGAGGNGADPMNIHTAAMGVWYQDGGKSRASNLLNLAPNSKFFLSGTAGDPTSFVPNPTAVTTPAEANRPNGDRKLFSKEASASAAFEVNAYEPSWTTGYSGPDNFDGDLFSAVGPFSMAVGDTITIVWAEAGGFRLAGLENAIAAARWAYEHGYNIPQQPATPEVKIDNTLNKTVKVRWDNRANTSPNFAGYKVWKASQAKQVDWLTGGFRGLDEYWRNTTVGPTPSSLLAPINPSFAAQSFVSGHLGVPDSWGPYELVAIIPLAQLPTYADNSVAGYDYAWEDPVVDLGFQYYYYVSAYTAEPTPIDLDATGNGWAGVASATTSTIETSNINKNGASGLWQDTYPWTYLNSFFPKTSAGQKLLGSAFTVKSALADPAVLASGAAKVGVKPNPYKKKALFDNAGNAFDHKVTFYNLPPTAKITILDVSGQIVNEINFSSNDPNNGSVFWDLFSKDGVEVASGLYIYVVEYQGGKQVGYLSILR